MATIIVDTTVDELDGSIEDGDVSLRDAVAAANAAAGADTIAFDAALFDGEAADILRLTQAQIVVTDGLTIDSGAAGVTITGDANGDDVMLAGGITDVEASLTGEDRLDDNSRIFDATADLTLEGLTLTGGRTTAEGQGGGAVRDTGSLSLIDSTVSGNSTAGKDADGGGISGGGYGLITLTNSTVSGNRTVGESASGGGIYGEYATVTNSTVSGNSTAGDHAYGGGISALRHLTLANTTITGNSTAGASAVGGGIHALNGLVVVTDSTVSGNSTAGSGAAGGGVACGLYWSITLTNSTVSGNSTAGDHAQGGGISGGVVSLTNSTVEGNSTTGYRASGGGIDGADTNLTNSRVSGNSTAGDHARGGGIFAFFGTGLTNSTVSGNSTAGYGASGGGIFGGGTLTNSTLSGNSTAGYGASGGGIHGGYHGDVSLTNSTLSSNSTAGDFSVGGGISGYHANVTNSTVSGNTTSGNYAPGGGIYGSSVSLTNSILLGNATTYAAGGFDEVQAEALLRSGGNIIGADVFSGDTDVGDTTAAAVFAATTEIAPGVLAGMLTDNGGPTQTILIKASGPAVDAGEATIAFGTDQRGAVRPVGPALDLGAVELQDAGSLVVTTAADVAVVDGLTSLREAVAFANLQAGADTVTFDPSVFNGEAIDIIRLTGGQIVINDRLIIDGDAGVTITGDANGDDVVLAGGITDVDASLAGEDRLDDNSRIFDATAGLILEGLTLTGGRTTAEGEGGGAVRGTEALTLIGSTVSGNSAAGVGAHGGGIGGGNYSNLTVTNSTISGNSARAGGGGIAGFGDLTVTNSAVSGNSTCYGNGGAISGSSVIVTSSTVTRNVAELNGDGIIGNYISITDSTVSGNYGDYGGGISGDFISVTNSTISGNDGDVGGGIGARYSVIVTNSTVSENSAFRTGGGIAGDLVTVTNSMVIGNNGRNYASGGGISGYYISVTNSTISGNESYSGGGISGEISVTVKNSTIYGNSSYRSGSGIFGRYSVSVTNSTVSGNYSFGSYAPSGGIYGGGISLTNSIVLGNATSAGVVGEVEAGSLVRTGGNIIGADVFSGDTDVGETTAAAVFAATTEVAPGVLAGVLADNGGPTETIALRPDPDNPAIGGADPATATATDQRGVPRDAEPDLGAYEAEELGPPAPFRIEAETLARESGFRVENVGAASGGKVIKSPNPAVEARASFTFEGQDGIYDLDLGYFDEKDGKSRLSVFVDGVKVDRFAFRENLGSKLPNEETRAVRHIAEVELEEGDVVELVGRSNRSEPLRIDYIDFTPVDDPPSFRIEAETLTREAGFRVEDVGAASGGKVIKSPNPAVEARASFTFEGQDGTYDLDLGYFDEKDGRSRLSVFVDGVKVDRFAFRENLGSKLPNEETRAVRHIAEVELEAGDVVELVGRSNRDEPLRIDYIDFTYVDDLMS